MLVFSPSLRAVSPINWVWLPYSSHTHLQKEIAEVLISNVRACVFSLRIMYKTLTQTIRFSSSKPLLQFSSQSKKGTVTIQMPTTESGWILFYGEFVTLFWFLFSHHTLDIQKDEGRREQGKVDRCAVDCHMVYLCTTNDDHHDNDNRRKRSINCRHVKNHTMTGAKIFRLQYSSNYLAHCHCISAIFQPFADLPIPSLPRISWLHAW